MLMEKFTVLGGLATVGLINWWEPLCNAEGKKLISGVSEEILRRTIRYSMHRLPAEWQTEGVWEQETDKRFVTHFSPTIMSLRAARYARRRALRFALTRWRLTRRRMPTTAPSV